MSENNYKTVEKQGWKAEEIAEESNQNNRDEIKRQMLRGNEKEGNPNTRDIAGAPHSSETPHGREETKNNL